MDITLKHLSNQSMVGISGEWTDAEKQRPILEKIVELSGIMGPLDGVHNGVLNVQFTGEAEGELEKELKKLSVQAKNLDVAFDNLARGIFGNLESNALLAKAPEEKEMCEKLKNVIFPKQTGIVKMTYWEESGEAKLLEGRLNDDLRKDLRSIPCLGGNLEQAVDAFIVAGNDLGKVESTRVRLAKKDGDEETVTRSDTLKARNKWIRVVNTFLSVLEIANIDETTTTDILQPLMTAVEKSKPDDKTPAESPAPTL